MDKKQNKMDDFLRNAAGSYSREPSPNVWKGISGALFFGNLMTFIYSYGWIVALFLLGGITLLWVPSGQDAPVITPQTSEIQMSELKAPYPSTGNQSADEAVAAPEGEIPGEETTLKETVPAMARQSTRETRTIQIYSPAEQETSKLKEDSFAVKPETTPYFSNHPFPAGPVNTRLPVSERYGGLRLQHPEISLFAVPERYEAGKISLNIPEPPDYARPSISEIEVSFVPELSFVRKDSVREALRSNGFEILGRMVRNEWSLSVGAGLTYARDNGMFEVNYNQYDSVGYYYKVTSFTIDPQSGNPDFTTVPESVFDTIDYSLRSEPQNMYTYLVIPVSAGIRVYGYRRFGIDFQAGISYSMLISEREEQFSYTNDNALTLSVTNQTPSRIKGYGQLSFGASLRYDISQRFSFHLSPLCKYHLKPLYEKRFAGRQEVWTYGIKTGVIFKF
ncbi:MAG: hypothetical protein JXA03_06105 [Bacteroidales bacterium]|nr:hypothetical protein [Bacteroidales bacterium]